MHRVKLYFIGHGLNLARCVGGVESRDLRGVRDAHTFDLPDDVPVEKCLSKSPRQIMDLGAKIVDPLLEPWDGSEG
jgi:hypothetical protein